MDKQYFQLTELEADFKHFMTTIIPLVLEEVMRLFALLCEESNGEYNHLGDVFFRTVEGASGDEKVTDYNYNTFVHV